MKEERLKLAGFTLDGFKCSCGEEAFNPWDVEKVRLAVNEQVKVRKVAHSIVVTLPKALAKLAGIREGDKLNWVFAKDKLALQKA